MHKEPHQVFLKPKIEKEKDMNEKMRTGDAGAHTIKKKI